MNCNLDDCKYYARLYEDDEDAFGCPWCNLKNDALPDECFWPFPCIAQEELLEDKEDFAKSERGDIW